MSFKEDFASMMEASEREQGEGQRTRRRIQRGVTVEGTIIQMGDDAAFVDVGLTVDARIDRAELLDESGRPLFKVGDRISATVLSTDDVLGPVLARSIGKDRVDDQAMRAAFESGVPVEGTVSAVRKGGFDVSVGPLRAFCPISHMDVTYVSEPEAYVGATYRFRIQEYSEGGRNIVVSRKALLEAERAERGQQLLEQLEVGADVEGLVTRLQKYGAFVDLGGVEGLIHVSELAHRRVGTPDEVVSVGERVTVRVLEIERPEGQGASSPRIRLSLRALSEREQAQAPSRDEVLTATVTRAVGGGLLADTAAGSGLIPKSELELAPGMDHRRGYPPGTQLRVVSLGGGDKLRFSVRRVAEVEERKNFAEFASGAPTQSGLGSFGELLSKKLGIEPPAASKVIAPQSPPGDSALPAQLVARDSAQPARSPQPASSPQSKRPELNSSESQRPESKRPESKRKPGELPPGVFRRRDKK